MILNIIIIEPHSYFFLNLSIRTFYILSFLNPQWNYINDHFRVLNGSFKYDGIFNKKLNQKLSLHYQFWQEFKRFESRKNIGNIME